jgi:hypothetical protein
LMLRSNSDLIHPQRLLIAFLCNVKVIKPLVMTAHDILGGDDEKLW